MNKNTIRHIGHVAGVVLFSITLGYVIAPAVPFPFTYTFAQFDSELPDGAGAVLCGDFFCQFPETCAGCPFDCGACIGGGGESLCSDGADNDFDGFTDCIDPDCAITAACIGGSTEINCTNSIDDDSDTAVDCLDSDCSGDISCLGGGPIEETNCADNDDNDADTFIDCDGSDCDENAACIGIGPTSEISCVDGLDNDNDSFIDCNDSDCSNDAACTGGGVLTETSCIDLLDNDADTFIDCNDSDCDDHQSCVAAESNCNNNLDDDADGAIDCNDSNCTNSPSCTSGMELQCSDGLDNDNDGATDCQDSDCGFHSTCNDKTCSAGKTCEIQPNTFDCDTGAKKYFAASSCTEQGISGECVFCGELLCGDVKDNDNDGKFDCDDSDCQGDNACQSDDFELLCDDTMDNDSDGTIDCSDEDCHASAHCAGESTESFCSNGLDDDGDGELDCSDPDCASDLGCVGICPLSQQCELSSLILCPLGTIKNYTSTSCMATGQCVYCSETNCADSVDNDTDGGIDCSDADCSTKKACENICGNSLCELSESCVTCPVDCNCAFAAETECSDSQDNDTDGSTDCNDIDCLFNTACMALDDAGNEICNDLEDNNNNGKVDCADPLCLNDGSCVVLEFCGNGKCELSENCSTCDQDCGLCPLTCGDGICTTGEGCLNCGTDCGICPSWCGNGVCKESNGESCETCEADCNACNTSPVVIADIIPLRCENQSCCGDSICQRYAGEDHANCPSDCVAVDVCGDNECSKEEDCGNCSDDCGICAPKNPSRITLLRLREQGNYFCRSEDGAFYICPENDFCDQCNSASERRGDCSMCIVDDDVTQNDLQNRSQEIPKKVLAYHAAAPLDIEAFLPDWFVDDWRDFIDAASEAVAPLKQYLLSVPLGWWILIGIFIAVLPVLRVKLRDVEDEW